MKNAIYIKFPLQHAPQRKLKGNFKMPSSSTENSKWQLMKMISDLGKGGGRNNM